MSNEISTVKLSRVAKTANWIAITGTAAALLLLALLHALSPEFDPSWRMISEYANGRFGWVLSLMFAVWALSSWALLVGIWRQGKSALFRVGLLFIFLAGLSEVLAAIFDINQPLHGLADVLGLLGLPLAAIFVTVALTRSPGWSVARKPLRWFAHLPWVSVALFAASFGVLFLTFQLTGLKVDPQAGPTAHAPAGVVGLVGLTNRLFAVVFMAWVVIVAWQAIKLSRKEA